MFAHFTHSRRFESSDRTWQLSASVHPHLSEDDQREGYAAARRIAGNATARMSAYEKVPEDRRPLIIGLAIKAGGEDWIRNHPKQMDWLRQKGITPAEAVAAHDAWEAERQADPLWRELVDRGK